MEADQYVSCLVTLVPTCSAGVVSLSSVCQHFNNAVRSSLASSHHTSYILHPHHGPRGTFEPTRGNDGASEGKEIGYRRTTQYNRKYLNQHLREKK